MTPLQKVAMGLVIVLVDAFFAGYDAVPDPVGWAMVLAGLLPLRPRLEGGSGLTMVAGLCLLVSVATYPPQVSGLLDEALRSPIALLVVGANIYLVYLLFRASAQVVPEVKPG